MMLGNAWKMKFAFDMVPEFRGDMSIFSILQEFKELLLAWNLSRVVVSSLNGPLVFLRQKTPQPRLR